MITTILFFVASPFSERDYSRYGIEILKNHFNVLILDCTELLNKEYNSKYKGLRIENNDYYCIRNLTQCLSLMRKNQFQTLAIENIGLSYRANMIRNKLIEFNIPRVKLSIGLLPEASIKERLTFARIFALLKNPKTLVKKFYKLVLKLTIKNLNDQYVLCSGLASLQANKISKTSKIISAHSLDYDVYLANKNIKPTHVEPYAVFLDEDMFYHSDYEYLKIKPPVTKEIYYNSMKNFFNIFAKLNKIKVIVAAHPRSSYKLRPDLWGDFDVLIGKTHELVSNASVVLCHQSTALSFAVLWSKPIIFLTTNELDSSIYGPNIHLFSKLLNSQVLNIDMQVDINRIESIKSPNEYAYRNYKDQYIKTPGSEDIPFWEIFIQYVKCEL